MRQVLFIFLLSPLLWGVIHSDRIIISPSMQGLQVVIPTKSKTYRKEIQKKEIQIVFDEEMQGPAIQKALNSPFSSIDIYPLNQQTIINLKAQEVDIFLSQAQNFDQLTLFFQVRQEFQWREYGLVLALLLALIGFLLYVKRKQKRHSPLAFQIKQQYFNKDCIITSLENEKISYLIFSNQHGCILLDKQERIKETKKDEKSKEG